MNAESGSKSARATGVLRFQNAFLLSLAAGISVLFLLVVRGFILAVLLAAVFAGLAYPLYRWFLALVANQAVQVSQGSEVWFQDQGDRWSSFEPFCKGFPW